MPNPAWNATLCHLKRAPTVSHKRKYMSKNWGGARWKVGGVPHTPFSWYKLNKASFWNSTFYLVPLTFEYLPLCKCILSFNGDCTTHGCQYDLDMLRCYPLFPPLNQFSVHINVFHFISHVYWQVLTTHMWMRYMWKDQPMQWNPSDWGGIDHVR